jgi:hypothetical protein
MESSRPMALQLNQKPVNPETRCMLTLFLTKVGILSRAISIQATTGVANANGTAGSCAAERGADGAARRPYQKQSPFVLLSAPAEIA